MARIKRSSGQGVRRASGRGAKNRTTGTLDRAMGVLPFSEEQWSSIWFALIIAAGLGLAVVIANLAGVPALAKAQIARIAADAGFEVRTVRVTGTDRLDEREVYARALAQRDRAMPLVEIEALRVELLELPWVKDARVSVQLPGTLAIDIVEREPHALLETDDGLTLIDGEGNALEPVSPQQTGNMLRITGAGATRQVGSLERLLAAAPALSPRIARAEWVGNRRWNLTFESDQVLALPEGADEAASALIAFAAMDGRTRLLGGKVAAFDMRSPPRIYMRVPGRADEIEMAANGEGAPR